jgi:hypothetical protein
VPICRTIRAGEKQRLNGLAKTGYCAAKKMYFHGVREHLIVTPGGMIAGLIQLSGNRHDVNGVYALLKTAFKGTLIGDSAYQPNPAKRAKLNQQGIWVHAIPKSNAKLPLAPVLVEWLHVRRAPIERRIGLFNEQFNAHRTLNRSAKHYRARRLTKALAHNISRHINVKSDQPNERVAYFRYAA